MIRARLRVGGDVLIAVNNQDAVVTEIDADLDDSKAAEEVVKAAEKVVEGMYPGLQTPIVKRDISANPSNATALWIEIAKMSDAKLPLPYDDPSEPFLYYLQFNAQNAAIAAELAGQVGERWRAMKRRAGCASLTAVSAASCG
jgi:hypothetical protein